MSDIVPVPNPNRREGHDEMCPCRGCSPNPNQRGVFFYDHDDETVHPIRDENAMERLMADVRDDDPFPLMAEALEGQRQIMMPPLNVTVDFNDLLREYDEPEAFRLLGQLKDLFS